MKYRRTRLNSEVIYSGKDLIRFNEKKGGGQTKNIWLAEERTTLDNKYGLKSLRIFHGLVYTPSSFEISEISKFR